MVEIAGQTYEVVVGSDVDRDGMYLEVQDATKALVAEVFYSDRDATMTFTGYRADVPLPVVEWMIAEARKRLIPVAENGS
jgi:hypothetical protein